jgi:pimeloyl-ACP methyl ester carboxylesterase
LYSDAPSALGPRASDGIVAASLGYIAALPDYVGYGDSSSTFHPYQHASTLASATVDMVRAARKFLSLPAVSVTLNGQLFLTGYSEGGYATLATQKLMESLPTEFTITASEPGAGSYDMTNTAITTMNESVLAEPANVAFSVKAYDTIYGLNRIASIFQTPYVDVVNTYFDGSHDIHTISMKLTSVPASLFNTQFLTDFRGSGETAVKAVIAENDIYNWAPKSPTRLFHGVDDEIVPYANATTALDTMTANGATDVSLQQCDAGNGVPTTHGNCKLPYLRDVVSYFGSLASGL